MLDKGAIADALHAAAHDHMAYDWRTHARSPRNSLPRAARDMTVRPVIRGLNQRKGRLRNGGRNRPVQAVTTQLRPLFFAA